MHAGPILVLLLATAGALPAGAQESGKLSVAMVGVTGGEGFSARTLGTVQEVLLSALDATGRFQVIGEADIARLVGFERQKQLLGCNDNACLADVAGSLGVRYIASADLGKLGGVSVLTVKLLDVRKATVAARRTCSVPADDALLSAATEIARALADAVAPPTPAPAPAPAPAVEPGTGTPPRPGTLFVARPPQQDHEGTLGVSMGVLVRVRDGLEIGPDVTTSWRLWKPLHLFAGGRAGFARGGESLNTGAFSDNPYVVDDLPTGWITLGAIAGLQMQVLPFLLESPPRRPPLALRVRAGGGIEWRPATFNLVGYGATFRPSTYGFLHASLALKLGRFEFSATWEAAPSGDHRLRYYDKESITGDPKTILDSRTTASHWFGGILGVAL